MIVIYCIKIIFIIPLGIMYSLVAAAVRIFNRPLAVRIILHFLRLLLKVLGIQWNFEMSDSKIQQGNTIYIVLNQSSFLDSLVTPLIPVKPIQGIINIEFALYPILGWMMSMTSFVIIRQWSWQSKSMMNRANNFLQAGGNMVISIEGKRSLDGRLNEYKKGPIVMAINNQSVIVPVVIVGARTLLPYRSLWAKPGKITIRLLTPIVTAGFSYENRNELKNRLIEIARNEGLQ